jgi:hypothetical protein
MGIGFVFFADHGGHSAPASRTCLAPIPAGILLARPLTKMFHFGTAKKLRAEENMSESRQLDATV